MNEFEFNKKCAIFLGWKETSDDFKINWVGCKTIERLNNIDPNNIPILEKDGDVLFSDFNTYDFFNKPSILIKIINKIESIQINNNQYNFILGKYHASIIEENIHTKYSQPISINGSKYIIGIDRQDCMIKSVDFMIDFINNKNK